MLTGTEYSSMQGKDAQKCTQVAEMMMWKLFISLIESKT